MLQNVVKLSDCRRPNGTELPKSSHLDTAFISAGLKARKSAIECINARLLEARVLVKSNIVAFVVAYAPAEEAPEWQKAKYTAAVLNSTVASVTARKHVFVLTDANAGIERRDEGGGE